MFLLSNSSIPVHVRGEVSLLRHVKDPALEARDRVRAGEILKRAGSAVRESVDVPVEVQFICPGEGVMPRGKV